MCLFVFGCFFFPILVEYEPRRSKQRTRRDCKFAWIHLLNTFEVCVCVAVWRSNMDLFVGWIFHQLQGKKRWFSNVRDKKTMESSVRFVFTVSVVWLVRRRLSRRDVLTIFTSAAIWPSLRLLRSGHSMRKHWLFSSMYVAPDEAPYTCNGSIKQNKIFVILCKNGSI